MFRIAFLLLSATPLLFAQAADPVEELPPLDVWELIEEALRANPELAALRARLEAFGRRVSQAGSLPDPMVGFSLMNYPLATNPFDVGRLPMTQTQISYSQRIPFPGTLRLRSEVASWDVRIGGEELSDREVAIAALVRRAYLRLYMINRNLEIVDRNRELLREFIAITESKYEVGRGLLQDVLRARVAYSSLLVDLEGIRQHRATAKAGINVLLNREPDLPLGDPPSVSATRVDYNYEQALSIAEGRHPELRALAAGVGRSGAAIELARKGLNPDFTLRFAYGYRNGFADIWTAGVTFSLPFWPSGRQRELVAEREAQRRVAEALLEAGRNRVALAVRTALYQISRTEEQMRLYRQAIIPQAEMSLESAVAGYQVDRVDFLTLLDNQLILFNLELDYERVIVEHELGVVDLEAVVGSMPGAPAGGR